MTTLNFQYALLLSKALTNTYPSTSFDAILEDYAFFERHASEKEVDLKWYRRALRDIDAGKEKIRMLDFGSGTGAFTRELLWCTDLHHRVRLDLTLVEPGKVARERCWDQLRTFTGRQLAVYPEVPQGHFTPFELIIANHSLYFVPDLSATVDALLDRRTKNGRLFAAMSGNDNFLIRCWDFGFSLIDESTPYHRAEDLEELLTEKQIGYQREKVSYRISFEDTEENRKKILRFLFGDQLRRLPEADLLNFFEPYSQEGNIEIPTDHYFFSI